MGFQQSFTSLVVYLFLYSSVLSAASTVSEDFIQCLTETSNTSISQVIYSPNNSSYSSIFNFTAQNLLFTTSATRKPSFIITPLQESHIQAAVICSKKQGFMLRVRSGGHDYEGLSYRAPKPFVLLDLINFSDINVDVQSKTAWAQVGATIGELYYRIAEKSNTLGFPASICPGPGIGGQIAGGGLGYLWRKYGLAADNVLDVLFVDVNGKLHDRKSMGEDLFWALRGGGGNSFGVIVAWKLQLVAVPPIVTFFSVPKTLEQNGTSLFYKWQTIADKVPKDLFLGASIQPDNQTIQISFQSTFQGRAKELLPIMEDYFPELGLTEKDCTEMSWVNSTIYAYFGSANPAEILLSRSSYTPRYTKGRSDFIRKPIPVDALEGLWTEMLKVGTSLEAEPMGGRMSEISESAIPFPHRKGNVFAFRYFNAWDNDNETASSLALSREVYSYMTPYVSKSPRSAYLNYKDLDLGFNRNAKTTYFEARVWGEHYFLGNFARLAMVKSKVDPENYFWDEQSIPLYAPRCNDDAAELIEVASEEHSNA